MTELQVLRQISAIRRPEPVVDAGMEWLDTLPLEQKYIVARGVMVIMEIMQEHSRHMRLGVAGAFELYLGRIATRKGWNRRRLRAPQ